MPEPASNQSPTEKLLGRSAPRAYLAQWEKQLLEKPKAQSSKQQTIFVFQIDTEWLAVCASYIHRVTPSTPVHTLPHRSNATFCGLVNMDGKIELCVSLNHLLKLKSHPIKNQPPSSSSRLVCMGQKEYLSFAASAIKGILSLEANTLDELPVILEASSLAYTEKLIKGPMGNIRLLDTQALLEALLAECTF